MANLDILLDDREEVIRDCYNPQLEVFHNVIGNELDNISMSITGQKKDPNDENKYNFAEFTLNKRDVLYLKSFIDTFLLECEMMKGHPLANSK